MDVYREVSSKRIGSTYLDLSQFFVFFLQIIRGHLAPIFLSIIVCTKFFITKRFIPKVSRQTNNLPLTRL